MYVFLKSGCAWLRTGWFWAFVLIALPNCGLDTRGYCVDGKCPPQECEGDACPKPCPDPDNPECPPVPCEGPDCPKPCPDPDNPDCPKPCPDPDNPDCPPIPCEGPDCPPVTEFEPGGPPLTEAVFCDIPTPVEKPEDSCASPAEAADPLNYSLSQAATLLVSNLKTGLALDRSYAATLACAGQPRKITYLDGSFPDGARLCLNCGQQIPMKYATFAKACVAKCKDLINSSSGFKPADVNQYCEANAVTATNHDKKMCYMGACTTGGNPEPNFVDPRRTPDKVLWTDLDGAAPNAGNDFNTLKRTKPDSMPTNFDAGAASFQVITRGDAWIDFQTESNTLGHLLGVKTSSCTDPTVCPDLDSTSAGIVGMLMHETGQIYGQNPGQAQSAALGAYNAGERFRVQVVANHDQANTATISFYRYTGACGVDVCAGDFLYTSTVTPAYPLRVDASLRLQNATLTNVTLVYIQQ
jgi:hypothetical protein